MKTDARVIQLCVVFLFP